MMTTISWSFYGCGIKTYNTDECSCLNISGCCRRIDFSLLAQCLIIGFQGVLEQLHKAPWEIIIWSGNSKVISKPQYLMGLRFVYILCTESQFLV